MFQTPAAPAPAWFFQVSRLPNLYPLPRDGGILPASRLKGDYPPPRALADAGHCLNTLKIKSNMVALRILVQSLALKQTDVATGSGFLFIDAYLITPERGWVSASPTLPDVKSFQAHTISTQTVAFSWEGHGVVRTGSLPRHWPAHGASHFPKPE